MYILTFTCLKTLANFHQLEKFEISEAIRNQEKILIQNEEEDIYAMNPAKKQIGKNKRKRKHWL
jgi:hypothetical protein